MKLVRSYYADEISALVEILGTSGDISTSERAGMEMLVGILKHYEGMTKQDIQGEVPRPIKSLRAM